MKQNLNWNIFTIDHKTCCFQPNMLLKKAAEKRCLTAVCAVCATLWWMGGFSRLLLSCFSNSGCIGRSVCLFSETLFLSWASIVMCVADGDTNFRPHNNRTDNLFPVLLYIVPGSLQPDRSTPMYPTLQLKLVTEDQAKSPSSYFWI